jgi:hypothetical protein
MRHHVWLGPDALPQALVPTPLALRPSATDTPPLSFSKWQGGAAVAALPRLAVREPPVPQQLVDDRRQRVVVVLLRSDVDAEILLAQEAARRLATMRSV